MRTWIEQLEQQGCYCEDWKNISVSENTDLRKIRNVYFRGHVSIGANAEIINVPGGIKDVRIGNNVRIVNVARIECSPYACFGIGTAVNVLDETGHRIVRIYPGLSAQVAALCTRIPEFATDKLIPMIDEHIKSLPDMPEIGDNVEILDCGVISDVRIWNGCKVEGAMRLKNGSLVNNSINDSPLAYIGHGVDAENFIVEDGEIKGGCIIRNTYVGQGALLDKGFTSHDSLFFANCSMENGEACAVFAGPYTVSMHKSSLLIGCQTGFFNAGSGTNMSNHMYKLGPVHWGVLERGVKMASNAYIMHGSHIGAFSLVMGDHKAHPNTSEFPFSYLFGDAKGQTTIVPGAMLKSYGLKRDEEKWPARDRRQGHGMPLHDRITFSVLNPFTIGRILTAIDVSDKLIASTSGEDVDHNGLKLSKKHLYNGVKLYESAICKYVNDNFGSSTNSVDSADADADWCDLAGQIIPDFTIQDIMKAGSICEIEKILDKTAEDYDSLQQSWMSKHLNDRILRPDVIASGTEKLRNLFESDRRSSIEALAKERNHPDIKF